MENSYPFLPHSEKVEYFYDRQIIRSRHAPSRHAFYRPAEGGAARGTGLTGMHVVASCSTPPALLVGPPN